MAAAIEKEMSCLKVKLSATLVLTLFKSFGTDTNAMPIPPNVHS